MSPPPRLQTRRIVLPDGRRVGVLETGRGNSTFVWFHALSGESMLYERPLRRVAALGFHVVAIDSGGHGHTEGLGAAGRRWKPYVDLHDEVLDLLDTRRAWFAGHSMGGKLAVAVAARRPERALGVIAVNAPIGPVYEHLAAGFATNPASLASRTAALAADLAIGSIRSPRHVVRNVRSVPRNTASRLASLRHVPAAFTATVADTRSTEELRTLRDHSVPVTVIHGDRDLAISTHAARTAATTASGTFVRLLDHGHLWPLQDPAVLPAILADLGLAGGGVALARPGRVGRARWKIEHINDQAEPATNGAA